MLARRAQTRFVLLTLLLYGALQAGYQLVPYPFLKEVVYHFGMVTVAVEFINLLDPAAEVVARSNQIVSRQAILEVVRGCDGIGLLLLLTAPIVAFPASWRAKAIGLGLAFAGVYVLNQARIVGLYFVVAHRGDWFLPLHTFLIPTFLVIVCLAFFYEWTRRAAPIPAHEPAEG